MTNTTYVPKIRELIKFDVFETARWFLEQFKVKNVEGLTATIPIIDEDGVEIGLTTRLMPEFMGILLTAAGWELVDDCAEHRSLLWMKDSEGYCAAVAMTIGEDGLTTIERAEED